ncbi:MAG TPA: hypothetical protein VGM56_32235 [Byssovorax sp.]|jgi:hypothetical protein
MKLAHVLAVLAAIGGAFAMVPGCGGNPALDQDPKAVLQRTTDAIAHPTGVVSKHSMPNLFTKTQQQASANSAVSLTGLSSSSSVSSPASKPQGGNYLSCLDGDVTEGSFDMSCIDPAFSGTMEFKIEIDGRDIYSIIALEGVCQNATSECLDGWMVTGVTEAPQSVEAFAYITMSGPLTTEVQFGFDETSGPQGEDVRVVAYDDDGDSYVLDSDVTAGDGSVHITGANGTWSCSYAGGGASGSCTSTDSASFDWSGG